MALWKDTSGVIPIIHDDMDGAALGLSSWPDGMTQITQAEADAILNPPLTLAQAKDAQIESVNTSCQSALAAIVLPYPPLEVATWPNQYAESVAYTANSSASTPTLAAIATASGKSVADLAASVLAKAAAYTAASGAAVGKRQALTAQIGAAKTVAAVQAIVW